MLPDTGALTTVNSPDCLRIINLTPDDLQSPPQTLTYVADGSPMQPIIGSVQVQLHLKDSKIQNWISVHSGTLPPLVSYRECRQFALFPDRFLHPIAQVTHARIQSGNGGQETVTDKSDQISSAAAGSDVTPTVKFKVSHPPTPSHFAPTFQHPSLPFTKTTTPAKARTYFLKKYVGVLVRKQDLEATSLRPMQGLPMLIHLWEIRSNSPSTSHEKFL